MPERRPDVWTSWYLLLVVEGASLLGVYSGGGATKATDQHDNEARYTGPQELQRYNRAVAHLAKKHLRSLVEQEPKREGLRDLA